MAGRLGAVLGRESMAASVLALHRLHSPSCLHDMLASYRVKLLLRTPCSVLFTHVLSLNQYKIFLRH